MYNLKFVKNIAVVFCIISFMVSGFSNCAYATANTTFTVNASVVASCTVSATNLSFGNYTLTALNGTSTITTTCTSGSVIKIGLNAGTGTGATVTNRKMTSGSNTLLYTLYQDSARTVNWGNTPGTDTVNSTGTGAAQNFTVYGMIPANQTAPIGTYTDTITVTVTFS